MLQSLRARLAFLFAGTLVLATVIAAVVVVSLYQSYNQDQTVSQLRKQVAGLQQYYQALFDKSRTGKVRGPQVITSSTFETVTAANVFYTGPPLFQGAPTSTRTLRDAGIPPNFDLQREEQQVYPSFKPNGATREYIGVGAPIFSGTQNVGEVVLGRPLADVNNAWKNIIGLVGVGLAVGLAVALILATYVARRITHPLRVIGSAADKVARGDLDVNVVGKRHSDDELGQLATRFQGMVDRLREVDELERNFLMRVTHELRTPVTAISGHVQALNEGLVEPDELDASLAAVSEEVRRIGRLVDDLLDLTRLEAHQFRLVREEVGLESLLDQAATSFREKARVNDVQFDALTTGAPTVLSDGDRVLQVVTNLLDNAFRWTPRDGTVTLSYSAVNGNAAIHVSDTGPGIPKNDQDAVFHPFYSRRGEGGTGLGLSIGRELAHALGGRLTVESEVGHGTTFTLSLPTGPGR